MKLVTRIFRTLQKMKMQTLIFLGFLIIIKLVLGSVFLYRSGLDAVIRQPVAIASELKKDVIETEKDKEPEVKKDEIDIGFLMNKKNELAEEEKRLAKKEAELKAIEGDINSKIEKLTRLRDEIRAEITRKTTMEDQKFKHLIKVFSAMKPQNAADLIEKLDKNLAIELLSKMKGDDVGQILSYVDIEKAAVISEGLVKKDN